jgi:hypothetical protein
MKRSLWVARLYISDATKEKLASRHGIDWHDVNQAIVGASGLRTRGDTLTLKGHHGRYAARTGPAVL